ncbi:unnamed protein product [Mycena citricolor]|uniref:Uncharacterized protein n=1 Tax=Mycena citricolor TaxID=2018698 RepID=A0AAD2K0S4_9AGAR|nr:unnamed protein product [Mycena citricolor]
MAPRSMAGRCLPSDLRTARGPFKYINRGEETLFPPHQYISYPRRLAPCSPPPPPQVAAGAAQHDRPPPPARPHRRLAAEEARCVQRVLHAPRVLPARRYGGLPALGGDDVRPVLQLPAGIRWVEALAAGGGQEARALRTRSVPPVSHVRGPSPYPVDSRRPVLAVVNPPPLYAVPTPSDLPEGIFFHTRAVTFESDDQLLDRVTHAALWTESPKDLLRRDEIIETVSRWSGFFIDPGQIRFGCIKDLLPMYDPQDGTIGW